MTKKTINASMEIQSEDPETYNTLLNLQKTAHDYYIKYSSDMKSLCALWAGLNITLFLSPNATYLSGNDIIFFIIMVASVVVSNLFGAYLSNVIEANTLEMLLHRVIVNRRKIKGDIYTYIEKEFKTRMGQINYFHFLDKFVLLGLFAFLPIAVMAMVANKINLNSPYPKEFLRLLSTLLFMIILQIFLVARFTKKKKCFFSSEDNDERKWSFSRFFFLVGNFLNKISKK